MQERDLFGFSFQGLSAVECLFFAVYFVGAMIEPTVVTPTIDRRDIKPRRVADACNAAFDGETLAVLLLDVLEDSQYLELVEIRNFLSHRGAPGRGFFTGGEFHGQAHWNFTVERLDITTLLVPAELRERRAWLGRAVTAIVQATRDLVMERVP
jgi:hypothetical protein